MTAKAYDPKQEPGGVRDLATRWTITCSLKMKTAAQIGSHESDVCDQTFGRTEDGQPLLRGSTLAGALRNALNDWLTGYFAEEHQDTSLLLGYVDVKNTSARQIGNGSGKAKNGRTEQESPLIVFDAEAVPVKDKAVATIRDGVRIDAKTGLAEDGKKYDRELTLPGLVFPLRFDLLVGTKADEDTLLRLLGIALNALTKEEIGLGARKRRGLGRCCAEDFRACRYDLKTKEGWLAYCGSEYKTPLEKVEPKNTIAEAVEAAFTRAKLQRSLPKAEGDKRQKLQLTFQLNVDGTLLIRSPGINADDPDMVHLTEGGKAMLSGTSLAGAFRSHCARILNTLGNATQNSDRDKEREAYLDGLFGTAPERMRPGGSDIHASRVIVSECEIKGENEERGPMRYRQTRLKVDRFTGGPIDGALFEQVPVSGGRVTFHIEVQKPQDMDVALLLLAARDLTEGLLTIGGEASVGRGLLKGTVTATLLDKQSVTIANGGCNSDACAALQPYLNALANFAEGAPQPETNASNSERREDQP